METEEKRTLEILKASDRIDFVPGEHFWLMSTTNKYYRDPYNAFDWPAGVRKRVEDNKPRLLTLDSLTLHFAESVENNSDLQVKEGDHVFTVPAEEIRDYVWVYMPGPPNMTGENNIRLLAGDYIPELADSGGIEIHVRHALSEKEVGSSRQANLERYNDPEVTKAIASALSAAIAVPAALGQVKRLKEKKYSRREFLKLGGATLAVSVANLIARRGQLYKTLLIRSGTTASEVEEELLVGLVNKLFDGEIEIPDVVQFRNAILYDKTEDALKKNIINENQGASIVLGSGHVRNWDEIEDPDKRREIILKYKRFLDAAIPIAISEAFAFNNIEADSESVEFVGSSVRESIIRDITHYGIMKVEEPQRSSDVQTMKENIRKSISTEDLHTCDRLVDTFNRD